MKATARSMWNLLTPHERRRFVLVLAGVLLAALVEVAGIASIMPFLSYVSAPESLQENALLSWLFRALGFESTNRFLFFLGLLVLAVLVVGNALRALSTWALLRFGWMRNHTLSKRLLSAYLANPYPFFLTHNTTTLGKDILMETQRLVHGILIPGMHAIARIFVVLFITALLVIVDPILAVVMGGALCGAYGSIYLLARRKLQRIGEDRRRANEQRFRVATEAFGSIKLLKLMQKERFFVGKYGEASATFASRVASGALIGQLPRYALETIAFGGILVLVLYLLGTGQALQQMLPLIGLYAFAGYRLLPALQGIFNGVTRIRFNRPVLDALQATLKAEAERAPNEADSGASCSLPFEKELLFENVSFAYPACDEPQLREVNLRIPRASSIAFVGRTGSGKTTLAYLALGLLTPSKGSLSVDGVELNDANLAAWQKHLGYVPQDVFLNDSTVAENIAFGLPQERIDRARVEKVARAAQIHEFIVGELPRAYDTVVGERGTRLSGGERQRIGIARALYHDPSMLVLDEATSSLDGATEEAVARAIREVAETKTLLIIAHRLSTVRECNQVNVLKDGRIIAQGPFDELMSTCGELREIAQERGQE